MIYNKDSIDRNIKLISDIHNIQKNDIVEHKEIEESISKVLFEKHQAMQQLIQQKENQIEELEHEISLKTEEFSSKLISEEKARDKFKVISEDVNMIEEFMTEKYNKFRDNSERYHREKASIEIKDMRSHYEDLKLLYGKIQKDTLGRSKLAESVEHITHSVQDKLAESKSNIGAQEIIALLIVVVIVSSQIYRVFTRSGLVGQILTGAIILGAIAAFVVLKTKISSGQYVHKDNIYKVFNIIDSINSSIDGQVEEMIKSSEKAKLKADNVINTYRDSKIKEIEKLYEQEVEKIEDDYNSEIKVLETQSELGLGNLGIEFNLSEINSKQEELPVMCRTNVNNKDVSIYYASNHVLLENKNSELTKKFMENLATELIDSENLGLINIKLVDTMEMGAGFSNLLKLKDSDTQIIDSKIYTTDDQINGLLDNSITTISDRVLNLLSKEYSNIYEYNKNSDNKINYEFIFINGYETITDSRIKNKIKNILRQGREWGVMLVISGNNVDDLIYDHTDKIEIGENITVNIYNNIELNVEAKIPEYTSKLEQIYQNSNKKKEIDFVGQITKDIWNSDASEQLEVHVGETSTGGNLNVKLGGTGINHHILLGGNTGSGKTSFIHSFILSSCLKYSPEQLELILIDFKQGVEFQVYADYKLPHAKFLGLESDREYALNILKYVDADIKHRAELCKQIGASDIATYNKKSKVKMKRTIIIIDEFQELLRGQDNIEQTTRTLLDIIARIGRSFGVHLILSSQSIAGIPGGLSGIDSRLGTRIALRCNEDDSRAILSSGNIAAADLTQIGQGIYNDNQGRPNGNTKFTFGYVESEKAKDILEMIRDRADLEGYEYDTKVFYKSNLRSIGEVEWFDKLDDSILLGDSSSLTKSYVDIEMTRQSGENLVVITKDSKTVKSIKTTLIKSIYHSHPGSRIIEVDTNYINDYTGVLPDNEDVDHRIFGLRDATTIISNIAELLEERREESDIEELNSIYLMITNPQKIRELQEDDYSSEVTKQFNEILREGPYFGIHTINIVDTYRSIERVRSKIMNESCHRLVGRMNDMDSSYAINDKQASLIDTDIELIYYNDIANSYEKVRILKEW